MTDAELLVLDCILERDMAGTRIESGSILSLLPIVSAQAPAVGRIEFLPIDEAANGCIIDGTRIGAHGTVCVIVIVESIGYAVNGVGTLPNQSIGASSG